MVVNLTLLLNICSPPGEEKSIWWQFRLPLILCRGKSTFRRFLLIQGPCPCSSPLIFCSSPLIFNSSSLIFCSCSLVFSPRALIFCSWALVQRPSPLIFYPKLPLPLLPSIPANSQLQHPGGNPWGTGESEKTCRKTISQSKIHFKRWRTNF